MYRKYFKHFCSPWGEEFEGGKRHGHGEFDRDRDRDRDEWCDNDRGRRHDG